MPFLPLPQPSPHGPCGHSPHRCSARCPLGGRLPHRLLRCTRLRRLCFRLHRATLFRHGELLAVRQRERHGAQQLRCERPARGRGAAQRTGKLQPRGYSAARGWKATARWQRDSFRNALACSTLVHSSCYNFALGSCLYYPGGRSGIASISSFSTRRWNHICRLLRTTQSSAGGRPFRCYHHRRWQRRLSERWRRWRRRILR